MLVELRLDHRERQPGGDHLADLDLAQHVRQRADVILVPVREHDREHAPVLEVREVGQHEVDAEVLVAREGEPCVDQDAARPSNSYRVMFLPTSPSPPSGMMRSASLIAAQCTGAPARERGRPTRVSATGSQQPESLEAVADGSAPPGSSPRRAAAGRRRSSPEQVQRRLDRDRVRLHAEEVDRRGAAPRRSRGRRSSSPSTKRRSPLLHPRADDVRVDADAADPPNLEEREDEVVVAGVEVETAGDDVARLRPRRRASPA